MKDIKTRTTIKDIKVLDKSSNVSRRMKNAYIRTKEQTEQTPHDKNTNYINDAEDSIGDGAETAVRRTGQTVRSLGKKAVNRIKESRKTNADNVNYDLQCTECSQSPLENKLQEESYQDKVHPETKSVSRRKSTPFENNLTIGQKPPQSSGNQAVNQKPVQFSKAAAKESIKKRYTLSRPNELAKRRFIQSKTRHQLEKSPIPHAEYAKANPQNIQKPSQEMFSKALQNPNLRSNTKLDMQPILNSKKAVREAKQSAKTPEKSIKTALKATRKGTIKTSQRTIKTFRDSTRATVKTSQAAKVAAVKSAQTTQRSLQAARATAKAAAVSAKAAIRAMIAAIKAIIIATKSLISLIAAGGSIAFIIILVICISGLLLGSAYGIFYSNEKTKDTTPVMKEVISQLTNEFADQIRKIQNDNSHDTLEISGNSTISNWQEILAVYAVRTTSDPSNGMEVATLDDEKVGILRNVFWDMNKIDYWLETVVHEETVTTTDEDGNETTETITTTETILHINITSKSCTDMSAKYGFNPEQVKMLNELMKDEYRPLFMQLISN